MSVPDHTSAPASNGCPSVDSNSGLPCNRERGHDGEHRAEARYGWTDPIEFSPPPAWAVAMAREFWRDFFYPDDVPDLARLLASVREGALREVASTFQLTARKCVEDADHRRRDGDFDLSGDSERSAVYFELMAKAVLSLLTTPPGEAKR